VWKKTMSELSNLGVQVHKTKKENFYLILSKLKFDCFDLNRSLEEEIRTLQGQQHVVRQQQQENSRVISANQAKERQCHTRLNKLVEEKGQFEFVSSTDLSCDSDKMI
jgi:hypothetical protein